MGALERIERDLAALEAAIANIALEFHSTYESYLVALGEATKQQLILACYHICTQGYPEAFLDLSFNERQKMQQSLRQVAVATQEKLQRLVHPEDQAEESLEIQELDEEFPSLTSLSLPSSPIAEPSEERADQTLPNPNPQPLTLAELLRWQETLERGISSNLKTLSRDANRLLQQSGILPKQLPEPVLDAASKAEAPGEAIAGPPNLLNLIVETEDPEASGDTALHIIAINLRLSEIEFTDANATAWRHQIRNLSARLSLCRRDYQKKQRERAVLEAESAWRSSWFE